MTRNDPFVGELEEYLEEFEGSTPLPESVRDAIRAELPSTRQRPAWLPARRLPHMNTTMKLVLATAAVVVIALFGFNYLAGQNVGTPGLDDPTASPSPTVEPQALGTDVEGPGTFTTVPIEGQTTRFTFFMPSGWTSGLPWLIASDGAALLFLEVAGLYSDPCLANAGATDVPVGSTAAELAAALGAQAAYDTTAPTDVVVDGFQGVRMSLQMPEDLDYATCTNDGYWVWDGPPVSGEPNTWELWILDIDGSAAVLLGDVTSSSAEDLDELDQVIQSLDIEP
jgi:hypothetical protein